MLFCFSFVEISLCFAAVSPQSAAAQGLSQENGTAEAVGLVCWPHPDDLTALEDCDWPIRSTGARGAER